MQDRDLLARHGELMEMMDNDCCSSDNTDYDESGRIFYRSPPGWRSVYLRDFLRKLDKIMEHRSRFATGRRRKGPNQRTRKCLGSDEINMERLPLIGLPQNCYDQGWLAGLKQQELERLEVQPENHDFTIVE